MIYRQNGKKVEEQRKEMEKERQRAEKLKELLEDTEIQMEKGIKNPIEICMQFGMERDVMEAVLAEKYGLNRSIAEEKIKLYWNKQ